MIFPIITFPYTSRILGPEGTGKVNFATSLVSYFVLLSSLGIPLYGIREIARVRDDVKSLKKVAQELFLINLISAVLIQIGFVVFVVFNEQLNNEKYLYFIISTSIVLTAIGVDWLYQGLEKYSYITIRSLILSSISCVLIFLLVKNESDYYMTSCIGVLASMGSSILNFFNAKDYLFSSDYKKLNLKHHLKPLMKVFVMNFLISIYIQLDIVILGFLAPAKNVGYYTSAIKLTKMILAVLTSIGTVLLPRLSNIIANGLVDKFQELIQKSLSVICFLSIPCTFGLIAIRSQIILIFAGSEYLEAADCLAISAPIIPMIGITNILGLQILYPLGRDNLVTISVATGAIISLLLNILLIPTHKHLGSAIANLISELIVLVIMFTIVEVNYKIKWPYKSIVKYIISSIFMFFLVGIIQSMQISIWLKLLFEIFTGAIIYIAILYIFNEFIVTQLIIKLSKRQKIW